MLRDAQLEKYSPTPKPQMHVRVGGTGVVAGVGDKKWRVMKIKPWLWMVLLAAAAVLASGCALHYYNYPSHHGYWGPHFYGPSLGGAPCF